MHQKAILITYYKLCQGIRNESRINFRRQLRERMLQLRQQRRQAAELRNNPAAAAEGSAPLLSDEAPAGTNTAASAGRSDRNPGNFYAEGEEGGANRQRLNIVGPPERSPTLEGGPAYEDPRPLSRSVATSTAELPADSGGLYHVSEPLRTVWFRPGAAGNQEESSNSNSTSNLQLRRISRLNSAPGGGVTLATNNGGGSRGPRIESGGGAVASGIFEESVQRVTLAVGEGEAAPPPPPPLPHQQEEEEEQQMVEEERIVEDIVREMMRNEGSVRQRWVTMLSKHYT
jgi:hypothetical protein